MLSFVNLIDLGNILFFIVSIPQIRSAFINRKDLSAISYIMLFGYLIACVIFGIANSGLGAYIAGLLNFICSSIYGIQIYWKLRGRKKC